MIKTLVTGSLALIALSLIACSSIQKPENLYQALNGEQGVEQLVDVFIKKLGNDPQIFPYFAKASVTHFRKGFIEHLCDVTDGPCHYQGDSMIDIHTGMSINEADFNRVVELLVEAMEESGINYPTQNRVLAKLAPLRDQIMNR